MKEGTIVTFYSYKGGVGRTFTLASIGALLSLWGYKTLCIDWDLEAPGLHLYFKKWMKQENHDGLTELIQAQIEGKNPYWQDYVTEVGLPNSKEPLLFMSAGLQDDLYIQRMQSLDWPKLYSEHNLGNFLEDLRGKWKASLDFILIDSRTGITDIGGICTVQLPDLLFLLFTASNQSLYGSIDVVERARRIRANLPFDRAKLLVLPVATRFEGRLEYQLAEEWLSIFAKVLAPLYLEWSHRDVTSSDFLNFTLLTYMPYWSFGEKLPVIEKGTESPDDIGFPLETLAALVAQKLSYTEVLIRSRDIFVNSAKREAPSLIANEQDQFVKMKSSPLRLFISYNHVDERLFEKLEKHLSSLKRRVIIQICSDRSIPVCSQWTEELNKYLEEANIILLLISPDYLASDFNYSVEMSRALERHKAEQAICIPVILRPTDLMGLPFDDLQILPSIGRPITLWNSLDEAFLDVIQGIRKVIQELNNRIE